MMISKVSNHSLLLVFYIFFSSLFILQGCSKEEELTNKSTNSEITLVPKEQTNLTKKSEVTKNLNYPLLQKKIIYGTAKLSEVKQALTDKDIGSLTNTVHGLYSMRWHRGVYNLLDDMWSAKKNDNPDFAWELLAKAPVRIALASTINRIKIINTDEQLEYIRSHKDDEHEFHRAQVVVALGMNGDPSDTDYLKSMAMADNQYVAQSAISGLALMGGDPGKFALGEVWKQFKDSPRGDLAESLIMKVYNESPNIKDADQSN